MLQMSYICLCQDYSMIYIKLVQANVRIRLYILCVLAMQSSTMWLDQCSVESHFDVSVLTLHRNNPLFGLKQLFTLLWCTHFSGECRGFFQGYFCQSYCNYKLHTKQERLLFKKSSAFIKSFICQKSAGTSFSCYFRWH